MLIPGSWPVECGPAVAAGRCAAGGCARRAAGAVAAHAMAVVQAAGARQDDGEGDQGQEASQHGLLLRERRTIARRPAARRPAERVPSCVAPPTLAAHPARGGPVRAMEDGLEFQRGGRPCSTTAANQASRPLRGVCAARARCQRAPAGPRQKSRAGRSSRSADAARAARASGAGPAPAHRPRHCARRLVDSCGPRCETNNLFPKAVAARFQRADPTT